MLKALFVGPGYWVDALCSALRQHGAGRITPSGVRVEDLAKSARSFFVDRHDFLIRVGLRPGSRTMRGVAFDTFWAAVCKRDKHAKLGYYWIGTDVLNALNDEKARRHNAFFAKSRNALHIADAPWLSDELASIGIISSALPLPGMGNAVELSPLPREFNVLSYIPDNRFRFYGGEVICQVARQMASVRFDIVGGQGTWLDTPVANVHFHGWVSDMAEYYRNASVVVRLANHDGLGATVVEGLLAGRHVFYNYAVPHCTLVPVNESHVLAERLAQAHVLHSQGKLHQNLVGRQYALREWSPQTFVQKLLNLFMEHLNRSRP